MDMSNFDAFKFYMERAKGLFWELSIALANVHLHNVHLHKLEVTLKLILKNTCTLYSAVIII